MSIENAEPIIWSADDFQPGDRFAFTIQPKAVYEILTEEHPDPETVIFKARRIDHGPDAMEFDFTFPAAQPVSARRRVRTYLVPCMICKTPIEHEIDTAYYTMNAALCGKH